MVGCARHRQRIAGVCSTVVVKVCVCKLDIRFLVGCKERSDARIVRGVPALHLCALVPWNVNSSPSASPVSPASLQIIESLIPKPQYQNESHLTNENRDRRRVSQLGQHSRRRRVEFRDRFSYCGGNHSFYGFFAEEVVSSERDEVGNLVGEVEDEGGEEEDPGGVDEEHCNEMGMSERSST